MAEAASQANAPVPGEELASIAARAQTYTGASGAAIALSEGDITSMTCRAASGPAAPDIGMQLRLEGTFTGMAVQSGQALRCDDSDADKRVDAAACRALGTRAIVVVPIRDAETEVVIGVLAVFSGSKNAFNDLHVAVLRTMAREVAVAVQKARKAGISLSAPADAPVSAVTASVPARPVSDPGFRPPIPAAAPPARPVTSPSMSAAAAKTAPQPEAVAPTMMSPAPVLKPASPPPPLAPKEELLPMAAPITPSRRTITPPPPAEWKPAPPPPGRKLEVVETQKAETPRAVSFGTFDSVAQDRKPGGGGMGIWIGVGAALVVILGGYFAYSHFSSKPDATPTTQTAEAKQPQPAAPASTKTASETSSGSPSATPATTTANGGAVKPATSSPQAPPQQKAGTTPTPTPAQQQKPTTPAPTSAPPPRQQQVVERAAVTPNASPRQDEAPKGLPAPVSQIAVPMTTSTASVASPPPKVSQSTAAQLISQVPPKYPDMARTMHATGTVIVEATIGTDGVVKGVKVLSGHPLLRDAAANSVRQWRYKPATLNGQPVETTVQVTLKFGG